MRQRPAEILLAENDPDLAELIGRFLGESVSARVTYAERAVDALREELTARHDVVIASMDLPDLDGITLARRLRESNGCPIILLAEHPSAEEAIDAIRLGISDILVKPFELEHLSTTVEAAVTCRRRQRSLRQRQKRLRRLVARIICERRDLAKRIDLICHDFVHAHRRLAEKVVQAGILEQE